MLHEIAKKVVFYPCCAIDFDYPTELLGTTENIFTFCDVRRNSHWQAYKKSNPGSQFLKTDAWEAIKKLERVDILFYRRDGMSEGGSGIEVLGDDYLSSVFFKLPAEGGSIITDGSNAFGTRLDYMLSGRLRIGNFVVLLENNSRYGDALYEFKVSPA
jgi:hypothetical protein